MKFEKQTVIAHRGAKGLVEFENTMTAFEKAFEVGSDAIECDVRRTKDNIMIIVHDDSFENKKINELTYEELLVLTNKKGFVMPTLEDTLKWCKDKIFIDIELKEEGYEEEFVSLVKSILNVDQFFVRSFNSKSLIKIKKIDRNIKTVLLLGVAHPKYKIFTRLQELFPLFKILKTKCDMVSPNYQLVILGYVKRMHLIKVPVLVWTVDDEALMEKLLFKKKVDAIITNYPDVAINILKNKK